MIVAFRTIFWPLLSANSAKPKYSGGVLKKKPSNSISSLVGQFKEVAKIKKKSTLSSTWRAWKGPEGEGEVEERHWPVFKVNLNVDRWNNCDWSPRCCLFFVTSSSFTRTKKRGFKFALKMLAVSRAGWTYYRGTNAVKNFFPLLLDQFRYFVALFWIP